MLIGAREVHTRRLEQEEDDDAWFDFKMQMRKNTERHDHNSN